MRKTDILIIILLFIFGVFLSPKKAFAATVTWDGGGDTGSCGAGHEEDWSCGANWDTNSAPTPSDVATFNGTSTKNATIDSTITVLGIAINSGYTGIITQAAAITITTSGFVQSAGTFTGGSQAIDINDGAFTINSGVSFTSTSGTLSVERNFTVNSGATFSANSGTFLFDGTGTADDSTLACGSKDFSTSTITFTKTNYGADITIGSDCTLTFGNTTTMTAGLITNNGAITVGTGTWELNASFTQSSAGASTTFSGTTIDMNSKGDSTTEVGTLAITAGTFIAGNLTTLTLEGSLNNSGNKLPNGLNLTLDSTDNNDDATLNCGTATFATPVIINKTSYDANITIGSNCSFNLGNGPTVSAGVITNNGDLTVGTGTWELNASFVQSDAEASTTFSGTTIDINSQASATVYSGNLTLSAGSFTASSMTTLSIEGNLTNSANLLPNGLSLTIDGSDANDDATFNCGTATFATPVTINKTRYDADLIIGSNCNFNLGNDSITSAGIITNNGDITVGSGTWTINASYIQSDAGASTTFSGTTIDINDKASNTTYPGILTLSAGEFTADNLTTLNIKSNLTNSANLLPNNIALTLDGTVSTDTAVVNCGNATYNSVTVNKTNASATTTFSSSCNISTDFTRTDGVVNNSASAYILSIGGNLSMSTTDTFGGSNLTVKLNGTDAQTISQNAALTFSSPLEINKDSGIASLSTNLTTTGQACTVVEGTFDINGYDFNCGSTFTVQNGGSLRFFGIESVTVPTLDNGSTVIYKGNGDSSADDINLVGWTYKNLSIAMTDTDDTVIPGVITTLGIAGDLNISSGGFTSPTNLNVSGNFVNNGTFNHNSGTVTLNGDNQAIGGSAIFYNLTKTVSTASTLTFPGDENKLQTIEHTLTLKGESDNLLSLVSSFPDTQWRIDPQGTRDIEYLSVTDSNNINAEWIATNGLNITNGNNNTGWIFNDIPSLTYVMEGVNAGTLTNGITTNVDSDYNSIPFANMPVSSTKYAAHQFTVTSTASMGYTVSMKLLDQFRGTANPENVIDPFATDNVTWTTPQTWSAPDGVVANVNTGWIGANTSDTRVEGLSDASAKFGPVSTISHEVMYSATEDLEGTTATITFAFEINSLQPTDIYTGTVIYDIMPVY